MGMWISRSGTGHQPTVVFHICFLQTEHSRMQTDSRLRFEILAQVKTGN